VSSVTKHRKFVYVILAIFFSKYLISNIVLLQSLFLNSRQYVLLNLRDRKLGSNHKIIAGSVLVILFELSLDWR